MQNHIAIAALILAAASTACGTRPKAPSIQPRGQVAAPVYPTDASQALQLTEAKTTLEFNSNVLLWDDPTGEQVRAILDSTRETRVLRADAIDVIKKTLVPAKQVLLDAQAAAAAADQKVVASQGNRDVPKLREYMYSATRNYVDTTLAAMVQSNAISAADQAHAKLLWTGYCEGKLWEFAVSPLLARLYSERPTPNALCEAYYAEKKYFADAELCGKASSGTGKDYFPCIWNAGVVNSPLFPAKEVTAVPACSGGRGTRAVAILSWVARDGSGPIRDLLRNKDLVNERAGKDTYASNMRVAILSGGITFNRQLTAKAPALSQCRNAFARFAGQIPAGRDVDDKGVPYWQGDTIDTLVRIGETMPVNGLRYYLLPHVDSSDAIAKETALAAKLIGVNSAFAYHASVSTDYQPSYNDSQVNAVVGAPELSISKASRDAVEAGPLFPNLNSYDDKSTLDLKAAAKAAHEAVERAETDFDAKKESFSTVNQTGIIKNIGPTVAAGQVPGAAVFLNTYVMKVIKDGDQLCVHFKFNNRRSDVTEKGCVNIVTNQPSALPSTEFTADTHTAKVAFDRSASLITFTIPLDDHPEKLGFSLYTLEQCLAAHDVPFNNLPPASLVGKSFQLEVYGNQLRDLPIVTGNAYLLDTDAKTRLYSGSLTGDSFEQLRTQLFATYKL